MTVAESIAESKNQPFYYAIGGGIIYRTLMPVADEMWITHVDVDLEGDTYFPPIDSNEWSVEPQINDMMMLPVLQDKYNLTIKHYTRLGKNANNQRN